MQRKIAWEKWHHALTEDSHNAYEDEYYNEEDSYEDNENPSPEELLSNSIGIGPYLSGFGFPQYVSTPIGPFLEDDPLNPSNMFDCWVCYTNFKLTEADIDTLVNKIDGIECFEQMTPYRFFIGIGKMFNFVTVRHDIQKSLCGNLETPEVISSDPSDVLSVAMKKISEAFMSIGDEKNWTIFIGHDGNVEIVSPKQFGTYEEYYQAAARLKMLKNGNILTCEAV